MPTVLIADDEVHCRAMVKAAMKGIGFEVVAEAANGEEAVTGYTQYHPDLVLLDYNMPVKNGAEALEAIMAGDAEALVIMLTSVGDIENVKRCLELGAVHYIRKDTPIQEMKKLISETYAEYGG